MELKIPPEIAPYPEKVVEYSYRTQELLRLEHNRMGLEFKDEIISKAEWIAWQEDYFLPRSAAISKKITVAKDQLKKSIKYDIDLDSDFTE